MNIFYYSVHQILEDDEVRLLQGLGHNVFCLGSNNWRGANQKFREPIPFAPAEHDLYARYEQAGGGYSEAANPEAVLPPGFIDLFATSIIMHDPNFIATHWGELRKRPVIWRTIGQGLLENERALAPYRAQGLRIVRYSPLEDEVPGTLGTDALIRFYKDDELCGGWTGDEPIVLMFSNRYAQRYPQDAADYCAIAKAVPCMLGGSGNDGLPGAIGFSDAARQMIRYRAARAYLYASGLDIPYTLNFIEAWMTGVPVIVHAPTARTGPWFEIDRLIEDGETGFISRDVATSIACARRLLSDHALAQRIGRAGRRAAQNLFSRTKASAEWEDVLARVAAPQP